MQACWTLLPADDQTDRPLIDGDAVPVLTPNEWARIPRSWLKNLDYAEGVFLQQYVGCAEAGHIALVSGGEIYSLATNQEYKNYGPKTTRRGGGIGAGDWELCWELNEPRCLEPGRYT